MPKVLLVEDNEMNSDIIKRRLELEGFEVILAADGEVGIAKAQSELPNIIIMDRSMPKVDGWQATRHIKGVDETCGIPIIALTAHAMAGDREKIIGLGCDDYDTKPIDFYRLVTKINTLLEAYTIK